MASSSPNRPLWKPQIFNPSVPFERSALEGLEASGKVWASHDEIASQLTGLMESRNPRVRELAPGERAVRLQALVEAHLAGQSIEDYGRWVYYPWSGQLVHLLGPSEFREARLDRNRNKITMAEQAQLANFTVGIVGLSVGNAVALTLAMEGVGGHFKLADFDRLELTNMNRLRAATHQLELPKTVLAARQIFELDPYVEITLFDQGVTRETIDEFLVGDAPLDVVVDECDSIDIKYLIRERARSLGLPVVMETSDRGTLDIERFDEEPWRPLFHGLVPPVDSAGLDGLSTEEKVRHLLAILGVDELSPSMGASLLEVERSIVTWPQLASDVVLGGASVTVALRQLALGRELESGRRYLDIESHINACDTHVEPSPPGVTPIEPQPLLSPLMRELIEEAQLAPSGGNTQPWHFYVDEDEIWVTLDAERSESLIDRDRLAALAAVGASLENLRLAAAHRGYRLEEQSEPIATRPDVIARLRLIPSEETSSAESARLYAQIKARHTNRRIVASAPLTDEEATRLAHASKAHGIELDVVREPESLAQLGLVLGQNERLRILNPKLGQEMLDELHLEPASEVREGVSIDTCELSELDHAAMRLLTRPEVRSRVADNQGGQRLIEGLEEAVLSSSALCLLSAATSEKDDVVSGGSAMQRVWLEATAAGLALQPVGTLPYMAKLLDEPLGIVYDAEEHRELSALRQQFTHFFPRADGRHPLMLFRLHRAPLASARSERLELGRCVTLGRPESMS